MASPEENPLSSVRSRREALGVAADQLEAGLARPASSESWTAGVAAACEVLRAAFDEHVAEVEDEEGLLPQLRADEPRLDHAIHQMYEEHIEIGAAVSALVEVVVGCGDACDADTIARVRRAGVELLRMISLHRQAGADLIYNAYSVDIGGG